MKNSSTLEIALYIHTYFHIAELQSGQKRCIWWGHLHKFRSSRLQMFFKMHSFFIRTSKFCLRLAVLNLFSV